MTRPTTIRPRTRPASAIATTVGFARNLRQRRAPGQKNSTGFCRRCFSALRAVFGATGGLRTGGFGGNFPGLGIDAAAFGWDEVFATAPLADGLCAAVPAGRGRGLAGPARLAAWTLRSATR